MQNERTSNLMGAFALALSDAQTAASRGAAGLGPSACAALVTIGQNPGLTIGALSRILGLTHSVTVRLVEALAQDSLVERATGADKRQVALRLTAKGSVRRRAILKERRRSAERALAAVPDDARDRLDVILAAMLDALTDGRIKADHICRLCDEADCPEETCPVEQAALRIERVSS